MKYDALITLITAWERFENEAPESADLTEFGRWLARQGSDEAPFRRGVAYEQLPPEVLLNILLYRLDRRWELLTKPFFAAATQVSSLTELRILACVADKDQPKKHEVVADVLLENATGAVLIRRLVERGLMTEHPDPKDRRALRLGLTEAGRLALEDTRRQLWPLLREFFAPLSTEEKNTLLELLKRL